MIDDGFVARYASARREVSLHFFLLSLSCSRPQLPTVFGPQRSCPFVPDGTSFYLVARVLLVTSW